MDCTSYGVYCVSTNKTWTLLEKLIIIEADTIVGK